MVFSKRRGVRERKKEKRFDLKVSSSHSRCKLIKKEQKKGEEKHNIAFKINTN